MSARYEKVYPTVTTNPALSAHPAAVAGPSMAAVAQALSARVLVFPRPTVSCSLVPSDDASRRAVLVRPQAEHTDKLIPRSRVRITSAMWGEPQNEQRPLCDTSSLLRV